MSKVTSRTAQTDDEGSKDGEVPTRSGADHTASDEIQTHRRVALHRMLMQKRQQILAQIKDILGQSVTDDEQRRSESAKDVGDQAMMDLEREVGISLLEMQDRKRQLIDEAMMRLAEGSYGVCAECGAEISERRLEAVPFAKLCVECQSQQELMEKIEKGEERD
ncbi:MAG TPA: TraR/DksA family transcriptional regulator [Nitrospiraceae bacterium]|nr:TraR/DksA family transcriptional regulator [Nitrospiraceae bacterium]